MSIKRMTPSQSPCNPIYSILNATHAQGLANKLWNITCASTTRLLKLNVATWLWSQLDGGLGIYVGSPLR